MKIFIKNIPENTKSAELANFFSPYLKRSLWHPFRAKARIVKRTLVAEFDQDHHLVAHHAIVTIQPDEVAKSIIKKIHRTPFKGKRVMIREFVERSSRKSLVWQKKRIQDDAKTCDRRHHKLELETDNQVTFIAQSQFNRKHF